MPRIPFREEDRPLYIQEARRLLTQPASPGGTTNEENIALQRAWFYGTLESISELLSTPNLDANRSDFQGNTCLNIAVGWDKVSIVNALVKSPLVNVDAVSARGRNALSTACLNDNCCMTERLLPLTSLEGVVFALRLSCENGMEMAVARLLLDERLSPKTVAPLVDFYPTGRYFSYIATNRIRMELEDFVEHPERSRAVLRWTLEQESKLSWLEKSGKGEETF